MVLGQPKICKRRKSNRSMEQESDGMSYCRSCGAPIIWIRMKFGKMMPVDAAAKHYWNDAQGKDSVVLGSGEVIRCSLKGEGEAAGRGFVSHFSTCPNANKHRKGRS